jgi:biopolymer transport protein ExbD
MRYASAEPAIQPRPMSEINTTPLIDVMLVLLIMMIITIPVATNSVEVNLPSDGVVGPDPSINTIVITQGGRVLWNGEGISEAELPAVLAQTALLEPEPQLRFEPEAAAAYGQTARVLWLIKRSGVTNFGFAGNEKFRTFGTGS